MTTMMSDPGTKAIRARRRALAHGVGPVSRHATLTPGGVIYIVVTLFLAVGAVNAENNLLFWLFGVAIALLIASGFLSGNALMKLRVIPHSIPDARAGQKHTIRYEFANTSRVFPLFAVLVRERSRKSSSYRQSSPGVLVHLAPGRHASCTTQIQIDTRGRHTLESFRAESSFPFGIIRKWIRFDQRRAFIALPHMIDLKPSLLREQAVAFSDDPASQPRCGASTDYFGLRPYISGDPRRKIAWKQSARRGELVTIEYAQETSERVMIQLHRPRGSDSPVLVERAVAMVCAVAKQAIDNKVSVGIWIPWASIRVSPDAGAAQLYLIEQAMALLDPVPHKDPESEQQPPLMGRLIQISCTQASEEHHSSHLYADQPDSWMAQGASLPAGLLLKGEQE
jgi:uncharacterized protein (DUF58 family)